MTFSAACFVEPPWEECRHQLARKGYLAAKQIYENRVETCFFMKDIYQTTSRCDISLFQVVTGSATVEFLALSAINTYCRGRQRLFPFHWPRRRDTYHSIAHLEDYHLLVSWVANCREWPPLLFLRIGLSHLQFSPHRPKQS